MEAGIKKDFREIALRFAMAIAAPLIISVIGSGLTIYAMVKTMDTRLTSLEGRMQAQEPLGTKIAQLETTIDRHEKALDRDFLRHEQIVANLASKTDDQERRLTLLEAHFGETQALIVEIRADIKTLLSGGARH